MKTTKLAALIAMIALFLFVIIPSLSWAAEDGGALFKAKCAMCHKADASGNPAMKAPALKGVAPEKVKATIDTNAKHAGVKKALTAEQIAAVADYLKDLK